MIGGTDGSLAVQRDIVLGVCIHQEVQGGVWCGVDEKVDVDIGAGGAAGTIFARVTGITRNV